MNAARMTLKDPPTQTWQGIRAPHQFSHHRRWGQFSRHGIALRTICPNVARCPQVLGDFSVAICAGRVGGDNGRIPPVRMRREFPERQRWRLALRPGNGRGVPFNRRPGQFPHHDKLRPPVNPLQRRKTYRKCGKSAVDRPLTRKSLSFTVSRNGAELRVADKAIDQRKDWVRALTRRARGTAIGKKNRRGAKRNPAWLESVLWRCRALCARWTSGYFACCAAISGNNERRPATGNCERAGYRSAKRGT